jgi:hypothetical protein
MVWQNSTLHVALYDFASGTLQTVADIDPGVPQWAGPDANLSEFKPGTEVFVYAEPVWVGNDSFALTIKRGTEAGPDADTWRALFVDIAQRSVRVLASEGAVIGTFPDGSVLFRKGRVDGAMQLFRPGEKSLPLVSPAGPWTMSWTTSPDGKKVAWREMIPPTNQASARPPVQCCVNFEPIGMKDITVFDSVTGKVTRIDVSGTTSIGFTTSWASSEPISWSKDSLTLFYSLHPTKDHSTLYRLPLNGQPTALVEVDKLVGLDVVAEADDGSIYYAIIGQDCQNCVQLMRLHTNGTTEVIRANGTPMGWQVDEQGRLETIKDGGVMLTDLATGQSHQVNFPGEHITSGEMGWSNVGTLVPISPDGTWAAYAGSQSDAIPVGPDGRPTDRGKTIRIVRVK